MAEVLGIVASGLAVQQTAGQIGKSLFQLRQLWEQIQDAPEQIQDLMADLSSFTALLAEMEGQLVEGSPMAQQSVQLCRDALTRLDSVVSSLQIQLTSPRRSKAFIGALKIVVRRDELKRYEQKLERAFRLLQMSHQCYVAASTKALPDIMAQRIMVEFERIQHVKLIAIQQTAVNAVVQEKRDAEGKNQISQLDRTSGKQTAKDLREIGKDIRTRMASTWPVFGDAFLIQSSNDWSSFRVSLRPPLMQRIWNMQATRTYAGWQYVFNQGGPMSFELQLCIELDDDSGLLRIFQERKGSPCDYISHDTAPFSIGSNPSVFLHAITAGKYKIVTMLLKLGLAEEGHIEYVVNPASVLTGNGWLLSDGSGDLIRLLDRLGYRPDFEELGEFEVDRLKWTARTMDDVAILTYLKTYFPTYYQRPTCERLELSRILVTARVLWPIFNPRLLTKMETFKYLTAPQACLTESHIIESVGTGYSILGSAAWAIGRGSAMFEYDGPPAKSRMASWESLIRDAVLCKKDSLHPIEKYDLTPWGGGLDSILKLTPLLAFHTAEILENLSRELFTFGTGKQYRRPGQPVMGAASWSVTQWLRILHSCGVDLDVYGRVEKKIISTKRVTRNLPPGLFSFVSPRFIRLISIDVGPRPERSANPVGKLIRDTR